jgi:hypothetical protein
LRKVQPVVSNKEFVKHQAEMTHMKRYFNNFERVQRQMAQADRIVNTECRSKATPSKKRIRPVSNYVTSYPKLGQSATKMSNATIKTNKGSPNKCINLIVKNQNELSNKKLNSSVIHMRQSSQSFQNKPASRRPMSAS